MVLLPPTMMAAGWDSGCDGGWSFSGPWVEGCGAGLLAVGTTIGVLSTTAVCPAVRVDEPTTTAGMLVLLPEITVWIAVGTTDTLVEPTGIIWAGCEVSPGPGTCTGASEVGGKSVPACVDGGAGATGGCSGSEVSSGSGACTVVSEAGGRTVGALVDGAGASGGFPGCAVVVGNSVRPVEMGTSPIVERVGSLVVSSSPSYDTEGTVRRAAVVR